MASYNGIFERSSLGQSNNLPRTGTLNTSPDIIPFGIECVSNPPSFFSAYDQDPSRPLEAGQTNYIYLRGKNYSGSRIDDSGENRPRLFWAKTSLLLYPQTWNELTTSPNNGPFSIAADAGAVGVVNQPFIWQPPNIENDSYCLIAQVPSPGQDNSIPSFLSIGDFNNWVANHGGIAWRTIAVNNSTVVTISNQGMFYEQGSEGGAMEIMLMCKNLPDGTKVSFSAGAPGPEPAIFLPPTVVNGPDFVVGLRSHLPANYASSIYYNIQAPPGKNNFSNASVSLQVWYPVGSEKKGIQKVIVMGSGTFMMK